MQDPKLSEFSEDQLRLLLRVVVKEKMDLTSHVHAIQKNEMGGLLADNIREYTVQIEELNLWVTQIASSLYFVKRAEMTASN